MELVTGRKGSPHITSQQDRQKNQGAWGEDAYIMKTGNMLEPQVQSSNEIHIMDGALMFQGALFAVKVGTYDVVTINNGSQGMLRKDLIVARYTYDVAQNVESAEWVVIQGEPAESNPALPTPTSGDIQTGSTTVDCPVFAVNLDGINVTGVDIIPEYADTIPELMEAVAELNSKSSGTVTSVGMNTQYCNVQKSGGIGVVNINGDIKNSIGKWQEVTLFTSSILPKWTCSGVVTDQNGYTADITFNTSGEVVLAVRNKDVTDTWYRGQVVFVVA